MPAYLVFICRGVTDRKGLEAYWAGVKRTLEGLDVKPHIAYTRFEILEGGGPVEGVVMMEFPSYEIARKWYDSPQYCEVRKHRTDAADYLGLLVEGGYLPVEKRMPQFKV
jgi:uncharacterized protein (DUF1330 family)